VRNLVLIALLAGFGLSARAGVECNAQPDAARPQYIVGYGSLMQDDSRRRTAPQAGPAQPVEVKGYRRGWFARSQAPGLGTTFLGVLAAADGRLNAVIYLVEPGEVLATDRRERSYCRSAALASDIRLLERQASFPRHAQAWIYVSRPETVAAPAADFPIVQSYVDLFVSGCLEQEQRFALAGFARECLTSTSDWSAHWINDRVYPRRPFVFQPKAFEIDDLLRTHLPGYFEQIRPELPYQAGSGTRKGSS
jgi:hypothetical protein